MTPPVVFGSLAARSTTRFVQKALLGSQTPAIRFFVQLAWSKKRTNQKLTKKKYDSNEETVYHEDLSLAVRPPSPRGIVCVSPPEDPKCRSGYCQGTSQESHSYHYHQWGSVGCWPRSGEPSALARGGFVLLQHVSYGSEPVGSMPLSYEFSMPYLETIEDEDGEIITEDGHRRCILGTDTTEQHTLELSYTTRSRRYPTKSPAG